MEIIECTKYFYRKYAEALIFDDLTDEKIEEIMADPNVNFQIVLYNIEDYLNNLANNDRVEPLIKQNVKKLIDRIKKEIIVFNDDVKNKDKYKNVYLLEPSEINMVTYDYEVMKRSIDKIEKIIKDTSNEKSNYVFYEKQKKLRNKGFYIEDGEDPIECSNRQIRKSIVNDYYVLATHVLEPNDEVFNKVFFKHFTNDTVYLESLYAIINEYPDILNISSFKRRALSVLNYNSIGSAIRDKKSFRDVVDLFVCSYMYDSKDLIGKIDGRTK